jgi:putative DNA primase/helicase
LIKAAATAALDAAHDLVPEWLPEGYRRGQEWEAINPAREDTHPGSFSVNLVTGRWNDYADPDAKGGDLVSLLAFVNRCTQIEAARHIDRRLALGLFQGGGNAVSAALQLADRRAEAHERARAEAKETREKVAAIARAIWRDSSPADDDFPYLVNKHLPALGARINRERLLIPLYFQGEIVNLQFITATGEKRFLSGGRVVGCYSPIGRITRGAPLYICEGWATGATIHLDTGAPVACAMNARNLEPVALAFRERLGDAFELIIAGDDDRKSPDNPGRAAANNAALSAGAMVTYPEWPEDAPLALTDFNDLYVWHLNQGSESHDEISR